MRVSSRRCGRFAPAQMAGFFDAIYDMDTDNQAWLTEVIRATRAVFGPATSVFGCVYDASSIGTFRVSAMLFDGFCDRARDVLASGAELHTRDMVIRTYRTLLTGRMSEVALPEMAPVLDGMRPLGFADATIINGLDPSGLGVFVGLWAGSAADTLRDGSPTYRRMAHHLGAAYRCRRRLRQGQPHRSGYDATEGAEAILDASHRVVHATGPAQARAARAALVETAKTRDQARTSRQIEISLQQWLPLTSARWTLVDSFDRAGARYVVARENQAQVHGLTTLSDRERQVVAYLALGQSTKETGYALGISDATVRVLLGRAAAKLGVRSRAALLNHDEVRQFRKAASTLSTNESLPPASARRSNAG